MHRVRTAVLENRLTSSIVTDADYLVAIEESGRGWVIDVDGEIVGFAVGNALDGSIWALFVDPRHEGRGYEEHGVIVIAEAEDRACDLQSPRPQKRG